MVTGVVFFDSTTCHCFCTVEHSGRGVYHGDHDFFLSIFNRLTPGIPMGIGNDLLILMMGVGLFVKCYRQNDFSTLQSPINLAVLIWIGYNVAAFANPAAPSRVAWFYVIRPVLAYAMLFFFTMHVLRTIQQVKNLVTFLFTVVLVSALWGIYQAKVGFFQWELDHLHRTDTVHLVFNYGVWRSMGTI